MLGTKLASTGFPVYVLFACFRTLHIGLSVREMGGSLEDGIVTYIGRWSELYWSPHGPI